MIDRTALEALTPAKRAQLIYGEAKAEMSKRLWQAALGQSAPDDKPVASRMAASAAQDEPANLSKGLWQSVLDGGSDSASSPASDVQGNDALDALLTRMARAAVDRSSASRISSPIVSPGFASSPATVSGTTADGPTGAIAGLGVNARYASVLTAAAERVGVPAPALAAIVDAEAGKASDGSWKVYSRNPRSSAAGLGQFLNRTWEGMAETRGTWLNAFARQQGWIGADGQVRAESRAAMLAARYDPTAAINGIADYAKRNLDGLRRAGVPLDKEVGATARVAYLAHHLGLGDATRFLRGHGLPEGRARVLLDAQVGVSSSARRIAAAGDATVAHREWLIAYLDRNIRPEQFTRANV